MNVAVVAPAGTDTEAGTLAHELLDDNVTRLPPDGAGPLKVTVPVAEVFSRTVEGEIVTSVIAVGVTDKTAVAVVAPIPAVMVAAERVLTWRVLIVNHPVRAPAGMEIEVGTDAVELLEDKLTTRPFGPAGSVRVTVPVEDTPPATDVGLRESFNPCAGVIVKDAVHVTPTIPAVIVTLVELVTPYVETGKVAVVCPAGITTVVGTLA